MIKKINKKVKLCIEILNHTISLLGMCLSKKSFLFLRSLILCPNPQLLTEELSGLTTSVVTSVWHLLVATPQLSLSLPGQFGNWKP